LQSVLLDDFDDPAAARFDQNRAAVYDGVTIFPRAIFRRHIVIGDTFLRQNRANSHVLAILVGRAMLLDNIAVKAGTLVDAQNPGYATDHSADDAANDGTDRTGCSVAISGASLDPAWDPLGLRRDRERHGGDKGGNSDKATDHDISNCIG
jgi:hypothetical protein